jgi:hypothetical protein
VLIVAVLRRKSASIIAWLQEINTACVRQPTDHFARKSAMKFGVWFDVLMHNNARLFIALQVQHRQEACV